MVHFRADYLSELHHSHEAKTLPESVAYTASAGFPRFARFEGYHPVATLQGGVPNFVSLSLWFFLWRTSFVTRQTLLFNQEQVPGPCVTQWDAANAGKRHGPGAASTCPQCTTPSRTRRRISACARAGRMWSFRLIWPPRFPNRPPPRSVIFSYIAFLSNCVTWRVHCFFFLLNFDFVFRIVFSFQLLRSVTLFSWREVCECRVVLLLSLRIRVRV